MNHNLCMRERGGQRERERGGQRERERERGRERERERDREKEEERTRARARAGVRARGRGRGRGRGGEGDWGMTCHASALAIGPGGWGEHPFAMPSPESPCWLVYGVAMPSVCGGMGGSVCNVVVLCVMYVLLFVCCVFVAACAMYRWVCHGGGAMQSRTGVHHV